MSQLSSSEISNFGLRLGLQKQSLNIYLYTYISYLYFEKRTN